MMGVPGTDTERGLRTHSTGAIFYVDPNFPGTSDSRDGTDPTAPLTTVAAAIALCQGHRGDTIVVAPNNDWYYGDSSEGYTTVIAEEVTVNVGGVRIVGVAPANSMGVMWTPASNAGTCITVSAIDVTIEGFVFTEGNTYTGCDAIYCEWDGATLFGENLTVRHCTFDDTVDTAIQLEYSWWCDIHNNNFWQCDEYGIYVDAAGSGIAYCTIHDNIFHDCDVAMALLGGCDENHIYRNSIYNRNAEGGLAATNEGINTTGGTRNQIFNNYLSCLLPVPANGDLNDFNTAAATDAWVQNFTLNGPNTTNPT
jgi:hypothetical protein